MKRFGLPAAKADRLEAADCMSGFFYFVVACKRASACFHVMSKSSSEGLCNMHTSTDLQVCCDHVALSGRRLKYARTGNRFNV